MFWNHVFTFEFLHKLLKQQLLFQLLFQLKHFLPKELLLSLMDLLIYLIMLLQILQTEFFNWALDNFISVVLLFSNACLNLVFCLVVSNNSWGTLFQLNILISILKVTPVWILAVDFNLVNCESDNLKFTLLYSTIYIIHRTFAVLL